MAAASTVLAGGSVLSLAGVASAAPLSRNATAVTSVAGHGGHGRY